jgi:adhesin transport system membrane fusion protein
VRVIQHLEGGAIREILVTDGAAVKAGQPLLRLDLPVTGINPAELQVRLDSFQLTRARLLAESEGGALAFPEDVAARRPELVQSEREAFAAHQRQLVSTLEVLRNQVRQRELDIQELEATRTAFETDLKLAKRNLAMSEDLLEDELTSKMDHLKLVREVEALNGRLSSLAPSVPRAKAALEEAKERLKEEVLRFQRTARDELGAAELEIARTRELLSTASQQVRRADIKSPIDGTVKGMRYHTIGGVVRPGEPIMEIVPAAENLVVEAKLNPIDRGYVRVGLPAVVKLATYDFVRYGSLEGKVTQISADSVVGPEGEPYYKVVVETEKAYLGDDPDALPILPGLTATVDIQTGQKSVMRYIVKPMLKLRSEAFRER